MRPALIHKFINTLSLRTGLATARNAVGPTLMMNHSVSLLQRDINHNYRRHPASWSLFRLEESKSASLREGLRSGSSSLFCFTGTSHVFIFLLTNIQGQVVPIYPKVFCICQKKILINPISHACCLSPLGCSLLTHSHFLTFFFFFYCILSYLPCCSYCFPDCMLFCG